MDRGHGPQVDAGQAAAASWRASTRAGRAGVAGNSALARPAWALSSALLGLERLERLDLVAQGLAVADGGVALGVRLGGRLAGRADQQHGRGHQHQQGADPGRDQLVAAGHGVTVAVAGGARSRRRSRGRRWPRTSPSGSARCRQPCLGGGEVGVQVHPLSALLGLAGQRPQEPADVDVLEARRPREVTRRPATRRRGSRAWSPQPRLRSRPQVAVPGADDAFAASLKATGHRGQPERRRARSRRCRA